MAVRSRTPVHLLTGFLGSGKTTLLSAWLKQPALRDAAVIVNELGEVGLDDAVLGSAVDSTSLLADGCVCCTGLPGLEQALEDLFWARLHRKIPAFPVVAVETTGLADPAPVVRALREHPLLRERYHLAGVITTVGAPAGEALLARHAEAQSQVRAADVLVVTKVDEVAQGTQPLEAALRALNARAPVLRSQRGSLAWREVLDALQDEPHARGGHHAQGHGHAPHGHDESGRDRTNENAADSHHAHDHAAHEHPHDARAYFVAHTRPLAREALAAMLASFIEQAAADLLRLKGVVQVADGTHVLVQYAPGETHFDIQPFDSAQAARQPRLGFTVIGQGDVEHKLPLLADQGI